jgi:hypothetical protein
MNLDKIKLLIFKALGDKFSDNLKEADAVAWIRLVLMLQVINMRKVLMNLSKDST